MDNRYNANNQFNGYYDQPYPPQYDKFAVAAMILGICSLVFLCTFIVPLVLGSLGLIFVILSRRQKKKLSPPALSGLVTSVIGLICSICILAYSISYGFTLLKPENRDYLNQIYEQQYGIDFDEYLERLEEQFGDDSLSEFFNSL